MYCEQVMDFCMELVYGGYAIISDENNLTLSSMRPAGETNE